MAITEVDMADMEVMEDMFQMAMELMEVSPFNKENSNIFCKKCLDIC